MIYMISGHGDLTENEFNTHYKDQMMRIIKNKDNDNDNKFIVGDYKGCDVMSVKFLLNNNVNPSNIIIYHMFKKPRKYLYEICKLHQILLKGGFDSDEARDTQMTHDSDCDILWIRKDINMPNYDPNYISGTEKNYLRRSNKS